jgi:putative autoinducer-2 (AI-2) aldolase
MSHIFRNDTGKTVMLALDHGMALGPLHGLEKPRELLATLGPFVDSIMLNKGVLAQCIEPSIGAGIVLRVSGAATIAGPDITAERLTTTVEEALRLSVDAVATSIFVGAESEHSSIAGLALLVDECHRYGMPVLGVTAVGKDREKGFDPRYLGLAVRVAAEMGADIIKTYYCENGFEKVVEAAVGIPVVIAGGPQMENNLKVLETAEHAMRLGARGVDMGRNVWQSDDPLAMLKALRSIIHEGATAADAQGRFWG